MLEQPVTSLSSLPSPPRLHWGWVLALTILTLGLFSPIWLMVQGGWVARVRGKSKGRTFAISWLVFLCFMFFAGIGIGILQMAGQRSMASALNGILQIISFVLYLATVFTIKKELEESPIAIPLGGVMTFFFGPMYFQYHLQDYDTVAQPLEASA